MQVTHWLAQATQELEQTHISTARLDALVLLEDVLERDRSWLLAHPETELTAPQITQLQKLLNLRLTHLPLSYVRERTEFYGRKFVLTPAVLEPRPESETMIDLLKKLFSDGSLPISEASETWIADIGTGSGALGITAALELPHAKIDLLELDPKALKIAKRNVDLFTLKISTIESDLLISGKHAYDVLLCNLPYVPDDYQINRAASHEPALAIFGGPDGLDIYRKLFEQIKNGSHKPLYILTESLPPQHADLQELAEQHSYKLNETDDFIQVFKLQ